MTNVAAIDLGLPSGTLWADRNLGADAPENAGDYFRFGEVTGNIQGRNWHTPTGEQIDELHVMCVISWESINGVKGVRLTGPNGNSIFFPFSGGRLKKGKLAGVGKCGGIWSTLYRKNNKGKILWFQFDCWDCNTYDRAFGFPIRPVMN